MRRDYLRIGALCKMQGKHSLWKDPNKVLRVAKRKKRYPWGPYNYFVVGVGDPVGHGVWAGAENLRPLTALEMLAMQAGEE